MDLTLFDQGQISTEFQSTVFVPSTMTLGRDGAPVTQAEMAFASQIAGLGVLYSINGFVSAMIDHMHQNGQSFVHDHSAFRMFYRGDRSATAEMDKVIDKGSNDGEKIAELKPILQEDEVINRRLGILADLGYEPVQILDLRERLNLTSFLYVHRGDPEKDVLPQNVPSVFLSFIPIEKEPGNSPEIIRRCIDSERTVLTKDDFANLAALGRGETISVEQAQRTLANLALSQNRLWDIMSSKDYLAVKTNAEKAGLGLPVAAEVMVVGYLLNHGTHRPQDLSANPANSEAAFDMQEIMEKIVGPANMNPISVKSGDQEKVGDRNLQGNTKAFMRPVKFADGVTLEVPAGFIEWASWRTKKGPDEKPLIHQPTGQTILAPVFDAGRTTQVFEKQKGGTSIGTRPGAKALEDGPKKGTDHLKGDDSPGRSIG